MLLWTQQPVRHSVSTRPGKTFAIAGVRTTRPGRCRIPKLLHDVETVEMPGASAKAPAAGRGRSSKHPTAADHRHRAPSAVHRHGLPATE
jgi:hypothetical protein